MKAIDSTSITLHILDLPIFQRRQCFIQILDALENPDIRFIYSYIIKKSFLKGNHNVNLNVFQDVADEILVQILSYLQDPKTLAESSRVNHQFYRVLTDNALWKRVCGNNHFAPLHPHHPTEPNLVMIHHRNNSVTKRHHPFIQNQDLFSHHRSKILRYRSIVPWKKIFRDNYLTSVNWMQGRYQFERVHYASLHGKIVY